MALKIQRSFRRVFIKVTAIVLAVFVLGVACLYIWFVNNSKELLIELVAEKSAGILKLELSNIDFDFLSSEVKIHKATIRSTNKNNTPVTYQVSFRQITLHTNSIWSLLLKRKVEIRQIKLYDPAIEVFNLQKDTISNSGNNLSLGMELGKLYNSIQEAINTLNTHSIYIINAKLILNNKVRQGKGPLIFSNIYFTLRKLNKHKGSYADSNNIIFNSSNQDISLTDGIHKLLFKKLALQKARNIILDSCTIIALPTQASGNNYTIQFKRLSLIGVDFDTLYKTNLIKADSVYCEDPFSTINLNPGSRDRDTTAKALPDLEKIIQEFSGNLDLGFVGVKNADIRVNIIGKKGGLNINSGKGNFQIRSLRTNPDSSKLISIKSFDMLIKGYLLYNADSSCTYSFDSIRFANNKLLLNNFSVHTSSGANTIRNYRNYSMPYFELLELNWPELIFKQNIKATEAILHDPTIEFIKTAKASAPKKSSIFNAHHTFDDFMEIQRLKIINGKINIKWGRTNFLQLQGFDLSLLPNTLKSYTDVKLRRDVESLFFSGGYCRIGTVNAQLRNVRFNAGDQIHAEEIVVKNPAGGIDSKINDVSIKNIYAEPGDNMVIDGLTWEHGNISVGAMSHHETKINNKQTSLRLKNVSGKQTALQLNDSGYKGDAFAEYVQITSLVKKDKGALIINGFRLNGKEIHLSNSSGKMHCENFLLTDSLQEFSQAGFEHMSNTGTVNIAVPGVQLTGNINSFINEHHIGQVLLKSPVINLYKKNTAPAVTGKVSIPEIKIDRIAMQEPVVYIRAAQALSSLDFSLPYSKGSEITAGNIQTAPNGITVGTFHIKAKKAEISKGTKNSFKIDSGIDVVLAGINIPIQGDSLSWSAMVNKLKVENSDGFTFNIKENTLKLKDITFGNCFISSSCFSDIGTCMSVNHAAWFATSSIKYYSKNATWQGFNTSYDASLKEFSLDSFNYHPSRPRDSVIADNPYQIDYINFSCSDAKISGLDLLTYFKEQVLTIQRASITRPSISVYRDKFQPYLSGIVKKLFVKKIMDISQSLSINQIEVDDGKVSYTERNGKTRLEGNLLLTRLHGNVFNIKNYDLQPADSLSLIFSGNLLNAAFFDFKVKESYVDPLYGFLMALKIEPAPLTFLNPLLAPLSNIKLKSGQIDTFYMNAAGNENVARGEMKFYYHDLHLQLLKNGEEPKPASIKHVGSVLVNAFVVKTNNDRRNGLIYFKRLKDRSFFNYMNKIIFSGVATSVGAKKNSQYRKDFENDTEIPAPR